MPQEKAGLRRLLGSVVRTALSGVAVYVAVSILAGKKGQRRLRKDFAIVQVSSCAELPARLETRSV